MAKFKKGKVVLDMRLGYDTKVVVHEKTDPALLRMLNEANERVKGDRNSTK